MAHATVTQLEAWTGQPAPAQAARLLQRASDLVDSRITVAYAVDDDGAATDAGVLAALADAVCAQVEAWTQGGSEEDDIHGPPAKTQVGPLSVEESWMDRLAPRASDRLRRAGLLNASITTTTAVGVGR